ncbi:hypothetical protein NGM10_17635 (plasmid) [Halorussus salilacus]|uniref:hypothetical protein n=1 Tax=Halorussus salilacus TaxID=2953750 RepID=UPI0020A00C6A|nr:hypothetical protein [Halorussus salilacus]USZ70019.1 hypothetical protein NGM10_17635 [Halorussus salilacus]
MRVLGSDNPPEYRQLASEIAGESESVYEITNPKPSETNLVVSPPDRLVDLPLTEMYESLAAELEGSPRIGIITGRTVSEARSLYFDRTPAGDEDALVVRGIGDEPELGYEDSLILTGSDVTANGIKDITSDRFNSFSILANGKYIHQFLSGDYLCGFPSDEQEFEFTEPQPNCVGNGEMDCPKNGNIIKADTIEADHIFLNACNPILSETAISPVNVGLSLLSNATAMIASPRVIRVESLLVVLHHALIKAGYDAGERTYLLNRCAEGIGVERIPFLLFGRPEAVPPTNESGDWSLNIEHRPGRLEMRLENISAPIVDLELPLIDPGDVHVTMDDGEKDLPYHTIFKEGDHFRLLLFDWGYLEMESLNIQIKTDRVSDEFASELEALRSPDRPFFSKKTERQLENARNLIGGSSKYRRRAAFNTDARTELRERYERASDEIGRAMESFIDDMLANPPRRLEATYLTDCTTDDIEHQYGECPYCGRAVTRRTYRDVLGVIDRNVIDCVECAYIADTPYSFMAVLLHGTTQMEADSTPEWELQFQNPYDETVAISYGITTSADTVDPESAYDPCRGRVTVEAGDLVRIPIQIDATQFDKDSRDGDYPVHAYVIDEKMEVSVAMRYAWVR